MKKTCVILSVVLACAFMAATAMAFDVQNRSAEMDFVYPAKADQVVCDKAGTIKYTFTQTDWDNIQAHLDAGNAYAEIRIALNGQEVPGPDLPLLCENIKGSAVKAGVPHSGELIHLGYTNAVAGNAEAVFGGLLGVEVSNIYANPDVEVYVWGQKGDSIIHVYITDLNETSNNIFWLDAGTRPWFTVGLYNSVVDLIEDDTTQKVRAAGICADVHSFGVFSLLTISNESTPQNLVFTGDNEIGHYGKRELAIEECITVKNGPSDTCDTSLPTIPKNCPVGEQDCNLYSACFKLVGTWPSVRDGRVTITVRTNGATDGATTQAGVFLTSNAFYGQNGNVIVPLNVKYYDADDDLVEKYECETVVKAVYTISLVNILDAGTGTTLRFCTVYNTNENAVAGTDVRFWVDASLIPCGEIFSGRYDGETIIDCNAVDADTNTLVYPYFTTIDSAWWQGLTITNLGSADGTAKVYYYEQDGDKATAEINIAANSMFSDLLSNIVMTPDAGNAGTIGDSRNYIVVCTDFMADGFAMIANGVDSMGYIPRFERSMSVCSE